MHFKKLYQNKNLNLYFHTSLSCLKRFYEGLLRHHVKSRKWNFELISSLRLNSEQEWLKFEATSIKEMIDRGLNSLYWLKDMFIQGFFQGQLVPFIVYLKIKILLLKELEGGYNSNLLVRSSFRHFCTFKCKIVQANAPDTPFETLLTENWGQNFFLFFFYTFLLSLRRHNLLRNLVAFW